MAPNPTQSIYITEYQGNEYIYIMDIKVKVYGLTQTLCQTRQRLILSNS